MPFRGDDHFPDASNMLRPVVSNRGGGLFAFQALRYIPIMPRYSTLGDLIDRKTKINIWCHNPRCHHHAELDLQKAASKLGREHSYLHDDLLPKLVCSKCGGKQLGLTIHPFTIPPEANPMAMSSNKWWR